jgi:LTXXQ motif family protein
MARPEPRRAPSIARTPPARVAPAQTAAPAAASKPAAQVQQSQINAGRQAAQERRQQLQQQLRQGNLSRVERRELQGLARQERVAAQQDRRLQNAEQRLNRLQTLQSSGTKLGRAQQRELQRLQNMPQLRERMQARQQQQQPQSPQQQQKQLAAPDQRAQQRAERRAARVTQQQAQAGRFAAPFQSQALASGDRQDLRDARRGMRLAARAAWQRGAFARYVPWRSAIYWPFFYTDVFYYTFWPAAYEPGYWAYAYDDFFDGVFFPDGAPYVEYADGPYEGPYYARATTGSAPRRDAGRTTIPGRLPAEARQICAEPDRGVTAWPFERIAQAVRPSAEQKRLLEQMEAAAREAADRLKHSCPEDLPMTPGGRLQAMMLRLQATLDSVKIVRPALEQFYGSLNDEQKARFNEIGPDFARKAQPQTAQQGDCGGEKSGLSALAVDRIEELVQPNGAQLKALDQLSSALNRAVERLQKACPTIVATTPVGRLEAMEQRLEAMIEAANTVRPPLDAFYAKLSNEQKAAFNRLSRTAQAN